jgi:MraZ protein
MELDAHGRILVPTNLREYAGLEKDVTLIGMGSRVEIWDTAKWLENNAELDMEQVTGALLGRETII